MTDPRERKMTAAVSQARARVRWIAARKALSGAVSNWARAGSSWTKDWTAVTAVRRSWAKAAESASVSWANRDSCRTLRPKRMTGSTSSGPRCREKRQECHQHMAPITREEREKAGKRLQIIALRPLLPGCGIGESRHRPQLIKAHFRQKGPSRRTCERLDPPV